MEENILVSILTPTYNRAYLLPKLYESLKKQTRFDFEWIVVDDGSSDNTEDVVCNFRDSNFKIKYLKKNNGGKHTALNYGLNYCNGIYTFIVDSDDWLTENAIEMIYEYYLKYQDEFICGFSFLRMYPNGKINVSSGRINDYVASYNKVRVYEQRFGDMAEVYKTNILKKYRFPEFENEKFLGEDVVWVEIGKKYNLVFSNEVIYQSEYLAEGLTYNRRFNNIKSCNGSYYRALEMESIKLHFKLLIKVLLQENIYGSYAKIKYKDKIKNTKNKFLFAILNPLAFFIKKKWDKKYLERKN